MKVLFSNRSDCFTSWGGDTTQMVRTQSALQKLGVEVEVVTGPLSDLKRFDLVHVFNIQNAPVGVEQIRHARSHGKPIALSTIFWDLRHLNRNVSANSRYTRVRRALGALVRSIRSQPILDCQVEMLRLADILLPNSHAELEQMALVFEMPEVRSKAWVVPNAAELESAVIGEVPDIFSQLPPEFVLEAARYQDIKGQLNLITSLMGHPEIPLVFVGGGMESEYGRTIQELARLRGNTWTFPAVGQDAMVHFYRQARVHALPSLRESPGLATLEAALCNANCVVSFHAPVSEYFGADAWVCDPLDPESIKNAILDAWAAPRDGKLGKRVRENFTYDIAARETLHAYNSLMNGKLRQQGR